MGELKYASLSMKKFFMTMVLGILIGYQLGSTVMNRVWQRHPRWGLSIAVVVMLGTIGFLIQGIRESRYWSAKLKENHEKMAALFTPEMLEAARAQVEAAHESLARSSLLSAPSITCPVCNMTSWNENDIQHGWCGYCHRQTSPHQALRDRGGNGDRFR